MLGSRRVHVALAVIAPALLGPAAPDTGPNAGVLVVGTSTTQGGDLRFGELAAGFARAGWESFVATDLLRPPPDAERDLIRARRHLDDARRYRRRSQLARAARSGDRAIQILERCANESHHKDLLVQALSERGATAVALEDEARAEAVFLSAISLDPNYQLDGALFSKAARRLFADVRNASRQLEYGSVRVEVPGVPEATLSVDFSVPRDPPYEGKLADGRHFISVRAPGRYEVVAPVSVRAGRQLRVTLRPPLTADVPRLEQALRTFDPARPASIAQLAEAAGLRFVALTRLGRQTVEVTLHDGRTGEPLPDAQARLSYRPRPLEIDVAVEALLAQAVLHDPSTVAVDDGPPWYGSWWAISLMGLAVAGAAATTAYFVTRPDEVEYRFSP